MKRKLLALILVVMLLVGALTSCSFDDVKAAVRDVVGDDIYLGMANGYHDIKDTIEGIFNPEEEEEHVHSFSTAWSKNDTHHWYAAACEHTDEKKGYEEHTYVDGVCVCGAKQPVAPHEHTYATEWTYDDNNHWHAATCEHTDEKSGVAAHVYVDGACVCGKAEPVAPHEHTYAEGWTYDDNNHWHAATCEHTEEKSDVAAHEYVEGVCVCGKAEPVAPHEHTYATEWTYDDNNHWHAATCEHTEEKSDVAAHEYVEGVCVCGKEAPHEHTFADEWTYDDDNHWHASTCGHEWLGDFGAHVYVDGVCVCGKTEPVDNTPDGSEAKPYPITIPGTTTIVCPAQTDVWYTFTASETGDIKLTFTTTDYYLQAKVNGETVGKIDGMANGGTTTAIFPLEAGITYLVSFGSSTGDAVTFDVTAEKYEAAVITPASIAGTYYINVPGAMGSATLYEMVLNADGTMTANGAAYTFTITDNNAVLTGPYGLMGESLADILFDEDGNVRGFIWNGTECALTTPGEGGEDPEDPAIDITGTYTGVYGEGMMATTLTVVVGEDTIVFTATGMMGETTSTYTYEIVNGAVVLYNSENTAVSAPEAVLTLTDGEVTGAIYNYNEYTLTEGQGGGEGGDDPENAGTESDPIEVTLPATGLAANGDEPNLTWYTFTVTENGTLTITYSNTNAWFYLSGGSYNNDSGSNAQTFTYALEANTTYKIGLGVWSDEEGVTVDLTFTAGEAGGEEEEIVSSGTLNAEGETSITVTSEQKEAGKIYLTFSPWQGGEYEISSNDLYISAVLNADGTEIEMNNNWRYDLEAYETYYVEVTLSYVEAGDYSINVSYVPPAGAQDNPIFLNFDSETKTASCTVAWIGGSWSPVWYYFYAKETGTLTFTADDANTVFLLTAMFGNEVDGTGTISLDVVQGRKYYLGVMGGSADAEIAVNGAIVAGDVTTDGTINIPHNIVIGENVASVPQWGCVWFMYKATANGTLTLTTTSTNYGWYVLTDLSLGGSATTGDITIDLYDGTVVYLYVETADMSAADVTFNASFAAAPTEVGIYDPIAIDGTANEIVIVEDNTYVCFQPGGGMGSFVVTWDNVDATVKVNGMAIANGDMISASNPYWWPWFEISLPNYAAGTVNICITPYEAPSTGTTLVVGDNAYTVVDNTNGDVVYLPTSDTEVTYIVTLGANAVVILNTGDVYFNEGDTVEITVPAGETVSFNVGAYSFEDMNATINVAVKPSEGGDEGDEPTENTINVTTTENDCYIDLYTFTAGAAGKYTFTVPAGLGFYSKAQYDVWGAAELGYYDNISGGTVEFTLAEGEELQFFVGAATKADWVITWTYEEPGTGDGDGGDTTEPEQSTTLVLGDNTVVIGEDQTTDGVDYTFVVETEGTYTFSSNDLLAIVFDASGIQLGRGQVSLAAGTYTVKVVPFSGAGSFAMNVSVETAGGNEGGDTTEPDGTEQNPFIIDELPFGLEVVGAHDVYYSYTTTEAVTIIIVKTEGSYVSISGGEWETTENGYTVVVAAGETVILNPFATSAAEVAYTYTFTISDGEGGGDEGDEPTECTHEWYEVWYHEDKVWPTCTTGGVNVFCCDLCGEYKTEATEPDPTAHDYVTNMEVYKEATCLEDGYTEKDCSLCGDHIDLVLDKETYGYHDWTVVDELAPTCQTAGYCNSVCSVCGETQNEEYPADAWYHVNEYSSNGSIITCSVCGNTSFDAYIDATETSYGVQFTNMWDGTPYIRIWNTDDLGDSYTFTMTLTDGVYVLTLTNMNETVNLREITSVTVTPAYGGIYVAITFADETTLEVNNDTHEHDYQATVVAPNCTEQGYTSYACVCGQSYIDESSLVDALGHTWVDATDDTPKHCSACWLSEVSETITVSNSTSGKMESSPICLEYTYTSAGTPESPVYQSYLLGNVGGGYTVLVDAGTSGSCRADVGLNPRLIGNNVVTVDVGDKLMTKFTLKLRGTLPETDPGSSQVADRGLYNLNAILTGTSSKTFTYDATAEVVWTAQVGDSYPNLVFTFAEPVSTFSFTVPTTVCYQGFVATYLADHEHTVVEDKAVEATCTEGGLTAGSHCSVCGATIVAQEPVEALGHSEVEDAAVDATCTEGGLTAGSHCSVCNEVIVAQEAIEALGHDYVENVVAPTCSAAGSISYTCSVCGDNYTEAGEAATGVHVIEGNACVYNCGYTVVAKAGDNYFVTLADALASNTEHTIVLVDDVTLTEAIVIAADQNVILDLAGHTISGVSSEAAASAVIVNNGTLTIMDSVGNGKITTQALAPDTDWGEGQESEFPTYANNTISNRGSLTIESGIIENTTAAGGASYSIDNYDGGVVVINGGSIVNYNNFAIRQFTSTANSVNSVTVNGGTVIGTRAVSIQLAGSDTTVAPNVSLTVNGGTLESNSTTEYVLAVYSYNFGNSAANVAITIGNGTIKGDIALTGGTNKTVVETVVINGGTFTGDVYSYADFALVAEAVKIYGGTFAAIEDAYYSYILAPHYALVANEDNTYTVSYSEDAHAWVAGETVAPTCVADGYTNYSCECGATKQDDATEATGEHDYVKHVCTVCSAIEAGNHVASAAEALTYASGVNVVITGTVSSIYQVYNDYYDNISVYVTDETGTILAFRMAGNVGIGDKITVTGTITLYGTTNQLAQGCTFEMVEAHVCSDYTEATCTELATCKVCGATTGELADHVYVDGKCECGAEEGVATITASKTMAELITANSWTSSTTKQTFTLDDNVTVKINGGNNTGKAYDGDHIRIYATDSPAGTITITVPEGYELVSVKVSAQTGTYAFLCVDGTTTDISNVTTAVSGNSVVLNSVKNGTNGKQVRVTAIEVVYKAV